MRIFSIQSHQVHETDPWPEALPQQGFVWMAFARREFELVQGQVQAMLQTLCDAQIDDLRLQDVLNNQLPSHDDYTSDYDLMVFRRLARGRTVCPPTLPI